jgi:hypothetical protein
MGNKKIIHQQLTTAIQKRLLVSFIYNGCQRTVEPYILGKLHTGHEALSAYQISGYSSSHQVPAWKNFALEKILSLHLLSQHFRINQTDYNPHDPQFIKIYKEI